MNRFFPIVFGSVFSLLIAASAISDFVVGFNPKLALKFNPLNNAARIDILSSELFAELQPDQLREMENLAAQGIRFEPFDARFYSLLGIIRDKENNSKLARKLYRHSLKLLPVEIQALRQLFVFSVNNGNSKAAIELADALTRRWPIYKTQVAQYIPGLLKNRDAYDEALKRFPLQPDGVKFIVDALLADQSSYDLASRMILDWRRNNVPNLASAINLATHKLDQAGQSQKASRFFYMTLSDADRKEAGYIHNGKFRVNTSDNIFDWKLVSKSGLNMKIATVASRTGENRDNNARALQIEFGDAPVKLRLRGQALVLPQSRFNFKVVYSTDGFKGPKPIEISILCTTGKLLTSLKLEAQSKPQAIVLRSQFKVPEENCKSQLLLFSNGSFAESWKNRFIGSIYLHEVSLVLSDL